MIVNVIQLFAEAALEVNGKKLKGLTSDTVISTLGLDSIEVMELISFFEEKLALRIPDEDLAKMQTLGDLAALIQRLLPPGSRVVS